jgi:ankyrin repeat protein
MLNGMELPEQLPIKTSGSKKIRAIEKIRLRERLYVALAAKNSKEVECLLQKDINPNRASKDKTTPLIAAIKTQDHDLIKLLLAAGADPGKPDRWKNFPLMEATRAKDIFTVKLLLQNKANPEIVGNDLQTPLIYSCEYFKSSGNLETIIYEFLKTRCNLNTKDNLGRTALHYICTKNHSITSLLLKNGADPNIKDNFKVTPLLKILIHGCKSTNQEDAQFLIANVQELVAAGGNPDIKNRRGLSARDYAKYTGLEFILDTKESHEQK